jgi:hypothetical protein
MSSKKNKSQSGKASPAKAAEEVKEKAIVS